MQIRTIFHNANFLKKSTPKAGRKLVCVLLMLVACAGAAWGAQFRLKNASATGEQSWDSSSTWQDSSLGISWGNADNPPTSSDRVYLQGAAGVETVIRLTSNVAVDQLIINSDKESGGTIRFVADAGVTITASEIYCTGSDGGTVNIILDNVSLSAEYIRINDDINENRYDGSIIFSGNGNITATNLMIFGDAASSPSPSLVDFNTIPVTVYYRTEINWDEKSGVVEVATDSTLGGDGSSLCIGKSDSWFTSENETTTVFSGTGTIDVSNCNFPKDTNHHIIIDEAFTLDAGVVNIGESGGVTIDGTGTLNVDNVNGSTGSSLSVDSGLAVDGTLPGGAQVYTYSLSSVDLTVLPASSTTVTISASVSSGTFAEANKTFAYTLGKIGTGNASFSFNSSSAASGSVSLTSGSGISFSGTFDIACSGSVTSGEGFKLTIKKPGGATLGVIEWTKQGVSWTGATDSDWNTLSNWSGISTIADLADEDIVIEPCTNLPEISSGTATVKSLTIDSGASVTLSGGTLTTESLACEGTGKFTASAGEVIFNGADGALSLSSDSYLYNASIPSGKKLTLNSPLTFKGSLDVSAGTLVTNGKAVIFSGTGTETIPLTIKTGSNTLDKLDVTSGFLALSGDLTAGTVTNAGSLNTNSNTLTFGSYSGNGTVRILSNATPLVATASGNTIATLEIGATRSFSNVTNVSFTNVNIGATSVLTLNGNLTVAGSLDNRKIIEVGAYTLSFGKYTHTNAVDDTITINDGTVIATGTGTDELISNVTLNGNATFNNNGSGNLKLASAIVAADAELTVGGTGNAPVFTSLSVDSGKTLTLRSALSVTSTLTNAGIINTNGKNLSFATISDTGTIKLAAAGTLAVLSGGSGGTINRLQFTANRSFSNITGLAFKDCIIDAGKELKAVSTGLTFSGSITNNGSLNVDSRTVECASYTGSGSDKILANNGTFKCGGGTINEAQLGGNTAVYNTGSGALVFTTVLVSADNSKLKASNGSTGTLTLGTTNITGNATLTSEATNSASVPGFTTVNVNSGKTLTLGSNLTLGTLTNNGTVSFSDKTLTAGTFAGNGGYTVSGAVTLSSGTSTTPGTVASVTTNGTTTFTQTGSYTLTSFTVSSGNTMSLGSDLTVSTLTNKGTLKLAGVSPGFNLTVTDTLENQSSIDVASGKTVSFAKYTNRAYSKNDSITVNNGYIVSTGTGTGNSYAIKKITMNGDATITRSGMGALKVTAVSVDADATLTIAMAGSATGLPEIAGVTVASNKTLTSGSDLSVTGTLTNNGTVKLAGTGFNLTAETLANNRTVNVGAQTLTFGSYSHSGSGDSLAVAGGTVICNGSGGSVTAASISGTAQMTHAGTGTLTLGTATVSSTGTALTFTRSNSGSFTVSTTAFSANATLKTEKTGSASALPSLTEVTVNNCTLTGDASTGFTAGKLTASGSSAGLAGLMTVTGELKATGNTTLSGTITAGSFTATGLGGKSLTVDGTLKVGSGVSAANAEETLKLSGASASSKLTVSGSGTICLNASQSGGTYLTVSTTGPFITDLSGTANEVIYTATFSSPSSGAATEFNGWNICSGGLVFIWKGGTGTTDTSRTSWNETRNWTVRIVPRSTSVVDIPSSASYDAVIPSSSSVSITTLTVGSGRTLTLNAGLTVSGELTNNGTIDMKNSNLSFGSYVDNTENGLIKLGKGALSTSTGGTLKNIEFTADRDGQGSNPAGFGNISGLTITNGTIKSDVSVNVTSGGLSFTGTLTNYGTITQNGNLTVTGALTNYGTIDMGNNDLTCASYIDDGNGRLIRLGTGTLSPGTGGTLNNIEFTATRSFENITGLTIKNGTVDSGVTLTVTSVTSGGLSFAGSFTNNGTITQNGNLSVTSTLANNGTISLQNGDLTVTGALDNNGTVNIGARALQFAQYKHTANTLTDALTIAGGSITAAAGGNGTGMIAVSSLTMNGNTTITNNGSGALKFASATANANVLLTSGGSGSAPVYSTLIIAGSNTLTLASDVTAGTVNIGSSATLNADDRGKNADPNFAGYVLTVTGNFINNNTTPAETDDVVYRGFIPQSGKVVFTGNGGTRHDIKGNIKFNDFYCHEADAKLYFDVGTTINVDHQIDVEGAAGQLIEMTTDSTVEGEKWTLDVIWDVAAGTPQHPKPKIKYVAPHKSISYSAILKGCLDNCMDDVTELLDSTNVNWFNDMPTILMTMAPVGGRQLFVLFSTEVSAAPGYDLRTALTLAAPGGSSIIDTSVPLTSYTGTTDKSKTAYIFGLTRDLTWGDLYGSDCLHVEIAQTSAVRVGTTRISYQQGVKHATSDFAVNAARMLFGYDNYIDSSNPLTPEKGTNSVRTWDNTDYISNRLHSDSDLLFQAQFDASVPEDMRLEMVAQYASELNTSIIGDNYRDYYDLSTRLWLPEPDNFLPLSTVAQTLDASQKIAQDNTSSGRIRNFSLHYSKSSSVPLFQMKDGEEIQFLFKVKNPDGTDLLIDHDYDEGNGIYTPSARHPVYAIRLADDSDITSFDLWSVALQSTTLQRGNVTILNNVINADQKEQTFVTIQTQKAGSLTVQVLTLDGAVITTLERGRKQAGTWGYSWDGTNGKGKPVARGMYFIRVIGPDIDETRKVMVVRD